MCGRIAWTALLFAWLAHSSSVAADPPSADSRHCLQRACVEYLLTPQQATDWHCIKDEFGPTFSGSPGWRKYLEFVERELRRCGAVDVTRDVWTYDRWHTTEWPDDAGWSLTSGGRPIRVASYGAYSGSTPSEGVTAELVVYDATDPQQDRRGKIVVFPLAASSAAIEAIANPDYESPAVEDSYPEPGRPVPQNVQSVSPTIWAQLLEARQLISIAARDKAAGAVFVFDSPYEQVAGLYTFPVPKLYDVPTLHLDRVAGRRCWPTPERAPRPRSPCRRNNSQRDVAAHRVFARPALRHARGRTDYVRHAQRRTIDLARQRPAGAGGHRRLLFPHSASRSAANADVLH